MARAVSVLDSHHRAARDSLRARIVLLRSQGRKEVEVAETVGASINTVSIWSKRFEEKGLEGACAGLVALSIWMMSRPDRLSVTALAPLAVVTDAKCALVDLDPIIVQWSSTGRDERVSVFLENVDSGRRTQKKTVSSNVRSVRFEPPEVLDAATSREFHGANRI